ncbi:MAG TPA: iron ABC transporter permease [Bacillota bacterium]|nr:iron ABC transporter permease [Bacillota bacterium]HOL10833.1 iron ABC transporter permease [Bacillota bacterium]HPO98675.1 iron ABC transporter permease [Bacillota bacterium]
MNKHHYLLIIVGLVILLLLVFMLSLSWGSVRISMGEIYQALFANSNNSSQAIIIKKIRLPRAIGAFAAGAALAVAGLLLQVFFRNPIVDSFVLGNASGASLLVGLVMLAGFTFGASQLSSTLIFLAAFGGSLLVMLLVMGVAAKVDGVVTLLIIGLMVGYLCNAFNSFVIALSQKEQLSGFVMWGMGSLAGITLEQAAMMALIIVPFLAIIFLMSKSLNALLLGDNYARSLGIRTRSVRLLVIIVASLLSGIVTAVTGPIGFVGLAVPHTARLILGGSNNRYLIPLTILIGAIVTACCDLIARTILSPVELPLTAVTSLFGAPVVIYLLLRRQQQCRY